MWNYYGGHMFEWGIFGWFMMVVFWGVVIAFIVLAINGFRNTKEKEKLVLDILKERYAKCEIDKKEFEEKSREIKNL